jgi:hypothetical protein
MMALLVALLALALRAEQPAKKNERIKPPYQRYLQGSEEKKAAEQETQLAQLRQAGKLAEALTVAEALAALRQKAQGADHWELVDAQWEVAALRCVGKHREETRQLYAAIDKQARQASTLEKKRPLPGSAAATREDPGPPPQGAR